METSTYFDHFAGQQLDVLRNKNVHSSLQSLSLISNLFKQCLACESRAQVDSLMWSRTWKARQTPKQKIQLFA